MPDCLQRQICAEHHKPVVDIAYVIVRIYSHTFLIYYIACVYLMFKERSLDADLFIVIAFRMLPEAVWTMPRLGTFNLHASLLPKYRGAAPLNWAVINGDKETGVTTFFLKHEIDTGDIIDQKRVAINPDDNVGIIIPVDETCLFKYLWSGSGVDASCEFVLFYSL